MLFLKSSHHIYHVSTIVGLLVRKNWTVISTKIKNILLGFNNISWLLALVEKSKLFFQPVVQRQVVFSEGIVIPKMYTICPQWCNILRNQPLNPIFPQTVRLPSVSWHSRLMFSKLEERSLGKILDLNVAFTPRKHFIRLQKYNLLLDVTKSQSK